MLSACRSIYALDEGVDDIPVSALGLSYYMCPKRQLKGRANLQRANKEKQTQYRAFPVHTSKRCILFLRLLAVPLLMMMP